MHCFIGIVFSMDQGSLSGDKDGKDKRIIGFLNSFLFGYYF